LTIAGATTLGNSSGSALTLNNNPQAWKGSFTFAGGNDLNLGAGAVTLGANPVVTVSSGTLTVGGAISGNYTLTKAGSGVLQLSGANVYDGATTVSAGTLQLGDGGTSGSLKTSASLSVASGAVLAFNQTDTVLQGTDFGSVISGGGSVQQVGSGTLVLSGANTFTGMLNASAGVVQMKGTSFSTTARTYNIASGAVLDIAVSTGVASGTSVIGGSGTFKISTGYFSNEAPNNVAPFPTPGPGRNVTFTLSYGSMIDVGPAAYMRNGGWQNLDWWMEPLIFGTGSQCM
jgi:autotransporter-associated beta strand protein